jgi:RNA polymerase sigma factor for flagellar operon FliA
VEQKDVNLLWKEFLKNHGQAEREQLILHYLPLVKRIAGQMMISLPPSVEIDDLIGAGALGLIGVIGRFDPSLGLQFETFASPRIRGAILDELRRKDWFPKAARQKARLLEKTIAKLENEFGRTVTDEEVAQRLGVSLEEYLEILFDAAIPSIFSLDESIFDEEGWATSWYDIIENLRAFRPADEVERRELQEILYKALVTLPERDRTIISLYYFEELTLKEIAEVMEISQSRVSQIHTRAILSLKSKIRQFLGL